MNVAAESLKPEPGLAPKPVAHKFGGSSLADAARIAGVADLLLARNDPAQVVVVSAMRGVTDALIELAEAAARRAPDWREALKALHGRHADAVDALLDGAARDALHDWLAQEFRELDQLLSALGVLGTPGREALDRVQGLGEVWSARILATHLTARGVDYATLDAREVLVVEHGEMGALVDWEASRARLADWHALHAATRVVVTGFVARDHQGHATTLGRNGSDYSGAIFAVLFDARELHIWTDVDGVLSADPSLVPDAVTLPALSYEEACELAYFGAKVLHPRTLAPAMQARMPVVIRNTFRPEHPGTRIEATREQGNGPVSGLSLSRGLTLLELTGAGMVGVPGTAERLFGALHKAGVSVVMISQGSSEHSICCVVKREQADAAKRAVERAFAPELAAGEVQRVGLADGIAALTAVGDGMAGTPGVAARLLSSVAHAGVNVRAIAQGASERSISLALAESDAPRALRSAHAGFWLSPQTVSIGLIGPGHVGQALIRQLNEAAVRLRGSAGLDLRLRAVASSRRLWREARGVDVADWQTRFEDSADAADLDTFAAHVHAEHLPHALIVDCSASAQVAARYADWLRAGIHVVTPNKQAGSGDIAAYRAIRAAAQSSGARFRYEATVGAGLPVIQTLRDLLDTGDVLHGIEGSLSGTLAWLFNRYDGTRSFSELVREARELGYTEPDPRDDLSGLDVARKLVILAREAGLELSLAEVEVESLVPEHLREVTQDEFMARLSELDAPMQAKLDAARSDGRALRYSCRFDMQGSAEVRLSALPADHPIALARLTDNLVQFTTDRYADNPLVVQGPGAGPEVTAAGVFADILRVAQGLGAKL
jgi:bifunctional aspartokinase / homoserine dehydrogenase 1